jgi:hypothetical protein
MHSGHVTISRAVVSVRGWTQQSILRSVYAKYSVVHTYFERTFLETPALVLWRSNKAWCCRPWIATSLRLNTCHHFGHLLCSPRSPHTESSRTLSGDKQSLCLLQRFPTDVGDLPRARLLCSSCKLFVKKPAPQLFLSPAGVVGISSSRHQLWKLMSG